MTSNIEHKNYTVVDHIQLFKSFAESLKLPLLQIARSAELSRIKGDVAPLAQIESATDALNHLLDTYLISLSTQTQADGLRLVPVSMSAILHEAAHLLQASAQAQSFDLELSIAGRYEPILAEPLGLQAALVSLGQVLLEAGSQQPRNKRGVITLAAHRSRSGIVAGMFSNVDGLSAAGLRRGQQMKGLASQPLNQLTSANGAGVFIACSLLSTMSTGLRTARYQKLNGLAATFTPSHQLALV